MNSMRVSSYPGGCQLFYNSSCVCLEGRTILTLSPGMISKLSVSLLYTTPPSWMSYKENRLYSHNILSRLAQSTHSNFYVEPKNKFQSICNLICRCETFNYPHPFLKYDRVLWLTRDQKICFLTDKIYTLYFTR